VAIAVGISVYRTEAPSSPKLPANVFQLREKITMHMQDRESMGDEGRRVSDRARKSGRQEARTRGTKAKPVNVIFKKGRQEIK